MKEQTKQKLEYYTKYTRYNSNQIQDKYWSLVDSGAMVSALFYHPMAMVRIPIGALADLAVFPYRLAKSHVSGIDEDNIKTR